jgi:type I restriction enzyme M protein
VVLPDNVLFEGNVGKQIRQDLMDKCNLHTILRLPTGIFYAQGVKTNVLFFSRGQRTEQVWVYDLRANMPAFGKRTPLTREHFAEFEAAYGADPHGLSPRSATGPEGRWRCGAARRLPSAATASIWPGSRMIPAMPLLICPSRLSWPAAL